jgi:hypothetical protein
MKTWDAKDPDEVADYSNAWTLDTGDEIATSLFALTVAAGLTIVSQGFLDNTSFVWLSGGNDGETAILTNTITTITGSPPRKFEEVIALPIVSNYPAQVLTPGYIVPNPTTLKAFFPAFAAVPNSVVMFWIVRANRMVDESWFEDDYAFAIMLLACHYMVGAGLGTGAEAQVHAEGMAGFSSIRSGQLTLQRGITSNSSGDVPAPWNVTVYGSQFYWLLKRNKPGGAVAIGDAWPIEPWWPPYPLGWYP